MAAAELRYEKAESIAVDDIPVIDFGPFLHGDDAARAQVAAQISAACRRIGFFYIVHHGVPESLRRRVLDESRAFFARPFAEKMKCAPLLDGQWCGYLPPRGAAEGTQPGGSLIKSPDQLEKVSGGTLQQFNMMRVKLADDVNYDSDDPIYQSNLWPAGAPDFVETMIVNQRALIALGEQLMRALSLALGLDEDYLSRFHRSPLATFGLNFYPAPVAGHPSANVGVGAHCDASSFTVLLQDDVGGLEVRHPQGHWIAAPYVPGAYVVNIGDTLMGWTNGHFVSTFHRVVSRRPVDRYSATMFMNPDREVTVAPIERFVSDTNPRRFDSFVNDEYMRRFFVKFYDQMFKKGLPSPED
ncbi:MAG: 2-oxoglutarate and iron-dependent oxygenase domain-containing protein [Solimonas sp.]